jgi:hypothetical protein
MEKSQKSNKDNGPSFLGRELDFNQEDSSSNGQYFLQLPEKKFLYVKKNFFIGDSEDCQLKINLKSEVELGVLAKIYVVHKIPLLLYFNPAVHFSINDDLLQTGIIYILEAGDVIKIENVIISVKTSVPLFLEDLKLQTSQQEISIEPQSMEAYFHLKPKSKNPKKLKFSFSLWIHSLFKNLFKRNPKDASSASSPSNSDEEVNQEKTLIKKIKKEKLKIVEKPKIKIKLLSDATNVGLIPRLVAFIIDFSISTVAVYFTLIHLPTNSLMKLNSLLEKGFYFLLDNFLLVFKNALIFFKDQFPNLDLNSINPLNKKLIYLMSNRLTDPVEDKILYSLILWPLTFLALKLSFLFLFKKTPGQKIININTSFHRLLIIPSELMGLILMPLMLFHLPIIFKRRSLNECIFQVNYFDENQSLLGKFSRLVMATIMLAALISIPTLFELNFYLPLQAKIKTENKMNLRKTASTNMTGDEGESIGKTPFKIYRSKFWEEYFLMPFFPIVPPRVPYFQNLLSLNVEKKNLSFELIHMNRPIKWIIDIETFNSKKSLLNDWIIPLEKNNNFLDEKFLLLNSDKLNLEEVKTERRKLLNQYLSGALNLNLEDAVQSIKYFGVNIFSPFILRSHLLKLFNLSPLDTAKFEFVLIDGKMFLTCSSILRDSLNNPSNISLKEKLNPLNLLEKVISKTSSTPPLISSDTETDFMILGPLDENMHLLKAKVEINVDKMDKKSLEKVKNQMFNSFRESLSQNDSNTFIELPFIFNGGLDLTLKFSQWEQNWPITDVATPGPLQDYSQIFMTYLNFATTNSNDKLVMRLKNSLEEFSQQLKILGYDSQAQDLMNSFNFNINRQP